MASEKESVSTYSFKYDEKNRPVSAKKVYIDNEYTETITYNEQGLPETVSNINLNFDEDIPVIKYTYGNDTDGNMIVTTNDGEEYIFVYNTSGKVAIKNSADFTTEYFYNLQGDVIEARTTGKGDNPNIDYKYEYEEVGSTEYTTENDSTLIPSSEWAAYPELEAIPTLDSCINTVELKDTVSENGITTYTYALQGNSNYQLKTMVNILCVNFLGAFHWAPEEADLTYFKYQSILSDTCGFDLAVAEDGSVFICDKEQNKLGVMRFKCDVETGAYMEISFAARDAKEAVQ